MSPAVVRWRPIHHLYFGTWVDGSHAHMFCGLDIPSAVVDEVGSADDDLDWSDPNLCRKCIKAWGEYTTRRSAQEASA